MSVTNTAISIFLDAYEISHQKIEHLTAIKLTPGTVISFSFKDWVLANTVYFEYQHLN